MPNTTLPENITPGTTATFEVDVEAAWKELNRLSYDTGWRDVTSLLQNGWTATVVRVRRVVDEVFWEFENLNGSAATSATIFTLSAFSGFAPVGGSVTETDVWRGATGTGFLRYATASVTGTPGFVFPATTRHTFSHRTTATRPALNALPGVAG